MDISNAEIGHLRRLLAWMECEYCLNLSSQKGLVKGLSVAVKNGMCSSEAATQALAYEAGRSLRCPQYVRDAVRSLKKAIARYESKSGIVTVK